MAPSDPNSEKMLKQNQAALAKAKLVFASIRGSPWISIFL